MQAWCCALLLAPLASLAQSHKSPLAGTWYPAEAPALRQLCVSLAVFHMRLGVDLSFSYVVNYYIINTYIYKCGIGG